MSDEPLPRDSLPFVQALGDGLATLPPFLAEHFVQHGGTRTYAGRMDRVWRAPGLRGALAWPALWLAARLETLFPETGRDVPFEIEHRVYVGADGRARMTWTRTFRLPRRTRRFDAVMVHDPHRGVIDDRLGTGRLETELHVGTDAGAVTMRSGRQWLHLGRLRIRLPGILVGRARVREWQVDDATIAIEVRVRNPVLGEVFGYAGWFRRKE